MTTLDWKNMTINAIFHRLIFRITACLIISLLAVSARAGDQLYDPEPPADSAYVRLIYVSHGGSADFLVDGKVRVRHLSGGGASDYLVLSAGKHKLQLRQSGVSAVSEELTAEGGQVLTVAFAAGKKQVFEDKPNANKLKSILAVYHLDSARGPIDVLTADGKTKVFSHLLPGTTNQISVNPVKVELIAALPGDQAALARVAVSMSPGAAYSILLLPGEGGKLVVSALQNKIERYTGK